MHGMTWPPKARSFWPLLPSVLLTDCATTYRLDVAWVLAHRFVEPHMKDVAHSPTQYEVRVFIGPDTIPGHVLGHWLDNFGAASRRGVPRRLRARSGDGHVDDPVGCSRWKRGMEALRRLPGNASVGRS
jgi:hypothetical protein